MQLLCDALAVLGSRHGIIFDPIGRDCRLVRFDTFEQAPRFALRAGLRLDGRERVFPLTREGTSFDLIDQRTTPCTIRWIGLDAEAALKVTLTAIIPFRPRDLAFSSIPVVQLQLSVAKLAGQFRWTKVQPRPETVELFIEIGDGDLQPMPGAAPDELDVEFASWVRPDNDPQFPQRNEDRRIQRDTLVASGAMRLPRGFSRIVRLDSPPTLEVYWCAWPGPALRLDGVESPFWHARQFPRKSAIIEWVRKHGVEIPRNATRVDAIVQAHNLGPAVDHLHAYTLHSWLINTWLVGDGDNPWLSIWEGSCYFHSTLDVEFTQAPFYLALWPELLGMQLRQWAEKSCASDPSMGAAMDGTRFMPHDLGRYAEVGPAAYPHSMEVEETANFIILLFAHSRRSGDQSIIELHRMLLVQLAGFLRAADTDGSGVPALGVANTVDDGSPAIQYGRRQIYLAMKTQVALRAAVEMLRPWQPAAMLAEWQSTAARILATIEEKGWQGDHYAVLLEASGRLKNPWTGVWSEHAEICGWDAPHIYTANVLPLLDMVGFDAGLNAERLRLDLVNATASCLREYGCVHTDYTAAPRGESGIGGLMGASSEPGWISMNMLRDLAALRRGVDLLDLAGRYWEWQVLTNQQGPHLFFDSFGGNRLCFYPRGVAVWGLFEAVAGVVIDRLAGRQEEHSAWPMLQVPRLWDATWETEAVTTHQEGRHGTLMHDQPGNLC